MQPDRPSPEALLVLMSDSSKSPITPELQHAGLPTPPPTIKFSHRNNGPTESTSNPSALSKHATSCRSEPCQTPISWRDLPLVKFHISRQLDKVGAGDSHKPSAVEDDQETVVPKEPLFIPFDSESPKDDVRIDEEETDFDEVVFVRSVPQTSFHPYRRNPPQKEQQETSVAVAVSILTNDSCSKPAGTKQDVSHHHSHRRKLQEIIDEEEDEEDVSYVGQCYKAPRHLRPGSPGLLSRADTPLQTFSAPTGYLCRQCRQDRDDRPDRTGSRLRGCGSRVLTDDVRSKILELLLCPNQSLFVQLRHHDGIVDWKDIADLVGARREDFDRVRQSARRMQEMLPGLMRRGAI
ncbi:uncharacterized protein IL334_002320 [Kwoniella shivajii]|uniref:Uncharacterized protein n=1 Tax=Kwoniella shivajii TaxID=564305 RepID=A0ABZ1CUF0_9TREE|nr:hypothetical protein IL334_002320 [Kwoniella shivajii]